MSILGKHEIPDFVSVDVFQGYNDTCAIRSQQLVLRDFGINVMEEELMKEAHDKGWYDLTEDSGTRMENIGNLLESHGMSVHKYYGANTTDLINELAQGHRVIAVVDADELMDPEMRDSSTSDATPNHALIVAGIDTTDPDDPKVILTDPGTGHVAQPYSLSHFTDATLDSNNYFVATDKPVPNLPNFDYDKGHIDGEIDGLSYEEWREEHADELTEPFYHSDAVEGSDSEMLDSLASIDDPHASDGCVDIDVACDDGIHDVDEAESEATSSDGDDGTNDAFDFAGDDFASDEIGTSRM